jgi:hypothetical protein
MPPPCKRPENVESSEAKARHAVLHPDTSTCTPKRVITCCKPVCLSSTFTSLYANSHKLSIASIFRLEVVDNAMDV